MIQIARNRLMDAETNRPQKVLSALWELHAERSSHDDSLNRTDGSFDLLLYIIDPCNIYSIEQLVLGSFIHALFFTDAVDADAILDVTRQYAVDADAVLDVTR